MRRDAVNAHSIQPAAILALAMAIVASTSGQPRAGCDQGLIQLPANINGTITVCSSLADQVPALSRQLQEITRAFGTQQQQLAEMNRLIKGVNSVGQNISAERQTTLLRNLFSQLQISQRVGAEQTERQMTALADGFERLKDQLLGALMNRKTAEQANAAVDGPLGDAIAQLDLTGAEQVLANIERQLKAIGTQVAEVNQRTVDIQKTLDQQRLEVPRVSSSLAAADVASLRGLTAAGLSSSVLEEALRVPVDNGTGTTAGRFFENSIRSRDAVEWFDSAMATGADPNMTVPSAYYGREGLLIAAMRAGNSAALRALLRLGASPHAYQDLFLTRFASSRFLFPLGYIADDNRLTLQEKQDLTKAFLNAGVVIPRIVPPKDPTSWKSVMYEVKELHADLQGKLGMTVVPSAQCCAQPTPICRNASRQYGEDWCALVAAMPKNLRYRGPYVSVPLNEIELQYLLNINRTKAFFLGFMDYGGVDYVLVEVARDGSTWTVYRYMPPEAGMGLCKRDEPNDTVRSDYCWRGIALQRVAGTNQMRAGDWGVTFTLEGTAAAPAGVK